MKIVLAHICYPENNGDWYAEVARAAPDHLEVTVCPLRLPNRSGRISWAELNDRWNCRDRDIITLHQKVADLCRDADVLWNYNGSMLHPDFVGQLKCHRVYSCFDDPEDFPDLVTPVAMAYDQALYGNAASHTLYAEYFSVADWLPIFTDTGVFDQAPAEPEFEDRDVDLIFAGGLDGYSDYRKKRLLHLADAFPDAICVGRGWPRGYVERDEIEALYRRAKVGWNIHRTTGPINQRLFDLPRFGVAQVCDNAPFLNNVFALESEILGFGPIEQGVTQIKRLLRDPALRHSIAKAGHKRFRDDYTARNIWRRFEALVKVGNRNIVSIDNPTALPKPDWLPYRHRERLNRLSRSCAMGWRGFKQSLQSRPRYQTWSFEESALLPCAHLPPAGPAPPPPQPIIPAIAQITGYQGSAVSNSPELLELWRGAGFVASNPDGTADEARLFLNRDQPVTAAERVITSDAAAPLKATVIAHGHPATIDHVFRRQVFGEFGECAGRLTMHTFFMPRESVPWLQSLDPETPPGPLWCVFTISRPAKPESDS